MSAQVNGAPRQRVHFVGPGESPDSIARLYGVDSWELVRANPHKALDGDDAGATFQALSLDEPLFVPLDLPCACKGTRPATSGMQGATGPSSGYQLPQNPQQVISSVLQQAGVNQTSVESAITSYTGIDASAQNAVLGIAQGGPVNLMTTAPIVAGALAFIPAIGPAVAAAYMVALPVLNAIGQLFSSSPATCSGYTVGPVCFSKPRPYGPFIPAGAPGAGGPNPDWQTWDQFFDGADVRGYAALAPLYQGAPAADVFVASIWPEYMKQLGPQLAAADVLLNHAHPAALMTQGAPILAPAAVGVLQSLAAQSDAVTRAQFLTLFGATWKKNSEFTLNGYQSANVYDLFKSVASAWNATHLASDHDWTPGTTGSPTATAALGSFVLAGFAPTLADGTAGPPSPNYPIGAAAAQTTASVGYLDALIAGAIDGQQYVPVTIHMGALQSVAPISPATSPAAKVAAGAGVVATAAGLAWVALGRPATWAAIKAAISAALE
jgi:hypothetical protein